LKNNCQLCERNVELTFHHLIPRKSHKIKFIRKKHAQLNLNTYGINVCKDCHKMIHKIIPHKQLALNYFSKERLMQNPQLVRFIKWVRTQTRKVK
jgi:hypothetical protein